MKTKRENPLKVLFSFSGEARGKMTGSVILAFIGEMFGMAPYFVVTLLAKELYEGTATVERAAVMAVTAAVCMCLRAWLTGLSSMRSHTVSFTILKNIRCALADKMAKVPMGVMLETPSGTFKTLMVDNVGRLEDIIAHMVPELPSNLAGPVFSIILVFVLDWRMGLAAFITVPLSLVFAVCMMRGYKEKMAVYLRSGNEMNAALVEYVGGIQVIKAFGQGSKSFGEFSRSVNFFHDSTLAWWRQSWFWMAGFKAVLPSTLLGTLPVGAWLYMQGTLELPLFLACIIIPFGFMAGLIKFGFALGQLSYMAPNLDPIQDFLDTPEQRRPEKPVKLGERSFRFDRVCFSYDGKKEVLHDVSFTARTGQITAIVGPSGSGKSTIAKLMAGFWDATGGTVSFGGQDIQNIPFDQLMGEISYVAQDNFLFDRSIRENIRMGDPGATDAEVEAAARAANCHDFIMNLEQGYDTLAGDAGDRLSGGERQRITIARAMLKKASVIILDEATAFADPESEAQIQQAISRLVRGKTLIVVAHRLNTIQNADQILVIDQGRLAACGRQEELAGIVCNILKTFSMAMMLMAVYVVISHLDSLTAEVIGQGLGILIASVFGRFLFQWLEDISMSAKGFDIFRDYRLAIGEKMKSAPMGYFSDQRLGTIQTTLTSTVVELEQYSMLFITDITGGVSMSVIIIVMMLFFSPWFSLLSLAGLLVGLYVLGMVQKAAAEHTPKVQEAQEELVTQSLEYIRGIAVLRSFSQTVGQDGAVYQSFRRRQKAALDQEKAALPALRLYILVFKLTGCALMFLSTFLYLQGAISLTYCFLFLVASRSPLSWTGWRL